MKVSLALLCAAVVSLHAETVADLQHWNLTGGVEMDSARPGPSGGPSMKIPPRSTASLKLRDSDGSGKVSFLVYDDGTIASPGKARAVGPRWGTGEANGRICVGAIMYAGFLQPEGSYCLIDCLPSDRMAWQAMKFLGARGSAGWKKWEFDFDPAKGLTVSIDGKEVPKRYFDWNSSQITGFNALTFWGDDSPAGSAQTIWIADISYDLGPPMTVKPGDVPQPKPPLPVAKGPAPEEETEKSSEPPVMARMDGYTPATTLLGDLKGLKVALAEGYAARHPRLLFFSDDREALQKRALERPDLWNAVLANAEGVRAEQGTPNSDQVRGGAKYWRVERIESAALAWFVTGDASYAEGAIRWMVAHCKEDTWGIHYRPNLDLEASWYLYHIAVGYDILRDQMSEADRAIVRNGLIEHARYVYLDHDPNKTEKVPFDQNHTYIPAVALMATALALIDDVPEAKYWLTRSYAILRRSRYVQSEDGYYYEGFGYWTYALNWQARGAELLARATGENLFQIPVLRDSWLFGLHLSLPGTPGAFGIGDSVGWTEGKLGPRKTNNHAMLWEIAAQAGSPESRTVGDLYQRRTPEQDYPATAFLWFNPTPEPKPLDQIPPYHYFPDHDVVAWRSGWGDDATSYIFRCGPPLGHKAADKMKQMTDWVLNCGHVHPDIGSFWMFAKGAYLAIDTGYTAAKWTRDHNTLLVDGKGQGQDGTYWNEKGIPYKDFDEARIISQYLGADYGFARGSFGSAYRRNAPGVDLTRSLVMTKRWLLVVDDMAADKARSLTWLCHSIGEFSRDGASYLSRQEGAALEVLPLFPADAAAVSQPTIVAAGNAPGPGKQEQRGYQLAISTSAPTDRTRFVNLLVPLGPDEHPPVAKLLKNDGDLLEWEILWSDGKTEHVAVDLGWKQGATPGPVTITSRQ
jgi:hypothetical protein